MQEEVGLHGARHVALTKLGKPQLAFNWDGGAAHRLTLGATGGYRMEIEIYGLASHAGGHPEEGRQRDCHCLASHRRPCPKRAGTG